MAWRMVLRRNPARSMTVVGDVAQTGSPAGATSWKDMLTPLVGSLAQAVPEAVPGDQPGSLDSAAALLTVSQAKGLEFDRVIVADPSGILAQSPNGGHDLYVAITRATHRLTVVYSGSLPPSLGSLSSVKTDG